MSKAGQLARLARGLCPRCGFVPLPGFQLCAYCREKHWKYQNAYEQRRREHRGTMRHPGRCSQCGELGHNWMRHRTIGPAAIQSTGNDDREAK